MAAALLLLSCPAAANADVIVPTNGMIITANTTFVPGTYNLPDGVSIGAAGITLDMNGATLVGTDFNNYGVTCIGYDNVTIKNGTVRGYYYGMRIENGTGITIQDNNLSENWVDPLSLTPSAPFLNINVGPNLGDRTNLGGGLFVYNVSQAVISGNTLQDQENGMDLYSVTDGTIGANDASDNTGWGIHLNASTGNVITGNVADRCIRFALRDSAGMLLVMASHDNQILDNSFQDSGDGFFIGNEHGCPSNNNLIHGNNGSGAGANAFEATFSAGNQFIDNIADGSNYGFWLGYSHSGTIVQGNRIRANNVNGIEIEHGQHNVIEDNEIIGNGGKGIVLRTDGQVHFPPAQYPCLNLPDQASSNFYTVRDNVIQSNFGLGLEMIMTTDSQITNNLFAGNLGGTAVNAAVDNTWSVEPAPGENIVGGPYLGGNYWSNYNGVDVDSDGLGDTNLPYTNGGQIALPGDPHPLIGSPDVEEFDNPRTHCDWAWRDLGRNTRRTGQTFDTANGTHFATDGTDLYLLEGSNSTRLSLFDTRANRYNTRAAVPEAVWDGGDLQYAGGLYYATVGVQFNTTTGAGKGPRLYAYDPVGNSWSAKPDTIIAASPVANEALAYSPASDRIYATIVEVLVGGDVTLRRKLAIFDLASATWIGTTSAADVDFAAGSEAEYLSGKIYVWPGSFNGGAVNGSDSYLQVYDIGSDTWSSTPTLQSAGVIPGFRTGAQDIWGVALASDASRGLLFVLGGETNRQLYVFDTATQIWSAGPTAAYDGGWGDSLEFVATSDRLYQIDGRTNLGNLQGTAVMVAAPGDPDFDDDVDLDDYDVFYDCLTGPAGPTPA
ncbi:MAG: NosD domain-containing protein, partial [Planctomycetota bacterium]